MSNQLNYNGILRSADDYLALDQTLPQNTSADGNGGSKEYNQTLGALEIVAEVGSVAIGLADGKTLQLKLQHSADNITFTDLADLYVGEPYGEALAVAAGTELGRVVIPTSAYRYIKAVCVSDDAAGTGKVNVFANYLPR